MSSCIVHHLAGSPFNPTFISNYGLRTILKDSQEFQPNPLQSPSSRLPVPNTQGSTLRLPPSPPGRGLRDTLAHLLSHHLFRLPASSTQVTRRAGAAAPRVGCCACARRTTRTRPGRTGATDVSRPFLTWMKPVSPRSGPELFFFPLYLLSKQQPETPKNTDQILPFF